MKKASILISLCAAALVGTVTWAQAPKPNTLHYKIKVKSESFGDMGTREMWVKGDKMRWYYISAGLPLRIIKNQQGVFLIHPWNKTAAKYPAGSSRGNPSVLFPGPTTSPAAYLKSVKAVKGKRELLNKQPCDVYSYTEPVSKRACKLWVDPKNGAPVKLSIKGEAKKLDSLTATYEKFTVGAAVPDSLFELPKGYKIRPMPEPKQTSGKITKQLNKREST